MSAQIKHGTLVISLDFELYWGVRDKRTLEKYGHAIERVHQIIPQLLELFDKYKIKATFSTVGLLYFDSYESIVPFIPEEIPSYDDANLSPYIYLKKNKDVINSQAQYHFAPKLIELISDKSQHEISTHTFSHYYCLEAGQNVEQFAQDLEQAVKIAQKNGHTLKSIVFPRNQYSKAYLDSCKEKNILCYRGNEESGLYKKTKFPLLNYIKRIIRFSDTYFNLTGHHCYSQIRDENGMYNVKGSLFFRPFSKKLFFLEGLKVYRIKQMMKYAAKNNQVFHLWWHPHNFGSHPEKNFKNLEKILIHFNQLQTKYGMESRTMSDFIDKQS